MIVEPELGGHSQVTVKLRFNGSKQIILSALNDDNNVSTEIEDILSRWKANKYWVYFCLLANYFVLSYIILIKR